MSVSPSSLPYSVTLFLRRTPTWWENKAVVLQRRRRVVGETGDRGEVGEGVAGNGGAQGVATEAAEATVSSPGSFTTGGGGCTGLGYLPSSDYCCAASLSRVACTATQHKTRWSCSQKCEKQPTHQPYNQEAASVATLSHTYTLHNYLEGSAQSIALELDQELLQVAVAALNGHLHVALRLETAGHALVQEGVDQNTARSVGE